MADISRKVGLASTCIVLVVIGFFIGFDLVFEDEKPVVANEVEQEEGALLAKKEHPYQEMLGRWQSACNHRHFDRPVIMAFDIRPDYIRLSRHFYFDKACLRSDEIERFEFFASYIEDVQILGDVWARLFRLRQNPTEENPSSLEKQEIFYVKEEVLYVSSQEAGPDYGTPWALDSNLGLRKTPWE